MSQKKAVPDLLVLRHGETEWNRAGRLQGGIDSALTPAGVAQGERQRAILDSLGATADWAWYASPQGRAWRTAEIARGPDGPPITPDPRLREIGIGDWAGRLRDEIAAERPGVFAGPPLMWYDDAPGGEGLTCLAARVGEFLASLHRPSVIVTHGITSRMLRCLALGLPATRFNRLEGGQGVVFRIAGGQSERLTAPVGRQDNGTGA